MCGASRLRGWTALKILALECSSRAASCALMDGEKLLAESYLDCGLTHSQTLLPLVDGLCRESGVPLSDVEGVAVSAGPGSFTGLRIGLAAAKGLSYALGIPCAGVSTLLALAFVQRGTPGLCCAALDARRGEIYNALFEIEGGQVRRLCGDRAISAAALADDPLLNGRRDILLCGDGASLCAGVLGDRAAIAPAHLRLQRASGVGAAALSAGEWSPPAALRPCYLRLSQAERERAQRMARAPRPEKEEE